MFQRCFSTAFNVTLSKSAISLLGNCTFSSAHTFNSDGVSNGNRRDNSARNP